MSETQELEQLRNQIDGLDQQIQQLINERAHCAQQVAEVKHKYAKPGEQVVFYRPEREAQVLHKVMARNTGPLAAKAMAKIFREIMSQCLALEEPLQVAYLGPEGTFTQEAAIKHFGTGAVCHSQATIDEVFRQVERGDAQYGVVPVENSTEGLVALTHESFIDHNVKICGEVTIRIHHNLLVKNGTEIKKIYAHAQSLGQCRRWLDQHYPQIERIAVNSNAEAARRAAQEEGAAAVASNLAADIYELSIVSANIEDRVDNSTRFFIIGREDTQPSGNDKTSVLISGRHESGSLYQLLQPFYQAGISLTRIETRPARSGAWGYVFFIDFEGHYYEPRIKTAMDRVQRVATDFKWLGSYPKAVL